MNVVEQWRPIPGWVGAYEVSDLGRVRSVRRHDARGRRRAPRVLRPRTTTRDHLSVALYLDGARSDLQVHYLVLVAFVGPRPEGMEGCHANDNPGDNRVENLRWGTRSENVRDSVRNGTHHMARKTHCPRGHEYTSENTYRYPRGNRACNECRRQYREERREQRRAAGREYMRRRRAAGQLTTNREAA